MSIRERWSFRWILATLGLHLIVVHSATSELYSASFQTPIVQLNKTSIISYQVNLTPAQATVNDLSIVLCQTSDKTAIDETNSWQVLNLLSGFCLTTKLTPENQCKNTPFKGREVLQLTLLKAPNFNLTGQDTLDNFFLCTSSTDASSNAICDYSSSLFDISPAVAGTKPVNSDSLSSIPTSFPTPTPLAITITSTKSTILQIQTPPSKLSSTSTAAPASSVIKPKKGLSTAAAIGIAFGVFSIFLLIGLLGFFYLRRSSARKRAQAARALNVNSFQNSKFKTEKDNSESPTTPIWGITHNKIPGEQSNGHVPGFTSTIQTEGLIQGTNFGVERENGVHLRDLSSRKNSLRRASASSVSISPIPSLRSESLYEPYRNSDQIQTEEQMNAASGIGSTAPFLREEGMSPEEMAKLEEEERRIDAAIAAAEAERAKSRQK